MQSPSPHLWHGPYLILYIAWSNLVSENRYPKTTLRILAHMMICTLKWFFVLCSVIWAYRQESRRVRVYTFGRDVLQWPFCPQKSKTAAKYVLAQFLWSSQHVEHTIVLEHPGWFNLKTLNPKLTIFYCLSNYDFRFLSLIYLDHTKIQISYLEFLRFEFSTPLKKPICALNPEMSQRSFPVWY